MEPEITNAVLAFKLDNLARTVNKIDETINGNGQPGLKTIVDRLQISEANRKRHFWIIYTASMGAVVTTIIGLLVG